MPSRILSKHPDVEQDLDRIFYNIARHNPVAADQVVDAIVDRIGRVHNLPEGLGSKYEYRKIDKLRRSIVTKFPRYLIFYTLTEDEVRILYVHEADRLFEERHEEEQRA
jgi:plasmid stabilization system protein ParE